MSYFRNHFQQRFITIISALCVVVLPSFIHSQEASQVIVKLSTDNQLIPLQLQPFKNDASGFSNSYLTQLRSVLTFDLNHNGSTQVIGAGKSDRSFYTIETTLSQGKLKSFIHPKNSEESIKIEPLALSGEIAQDRRTIHQLADAIHRALFDKDGIASTKILFTLGEKNAQGNPISEIWEIDYDGENARQITHENALCVTPAYIPPKSGFTTGNFLYTSYKLGQPKIFIASLKDGRSSRLTTMKGNQLMPDISRQRDKVVFISDVAGNPDLFLLNMDMESGPIGKPRQIFATRQSTQGSPSLSPDGKRVAFVSNKDGKPRIYIIEIPEDGKKLNEIKAHLITKQNRESSAPTWSPDGSKIAYTAMTNGARQIWVYDFLTNEDRQLTQGPANKENPTWAANSLHIAYNSSTDKSKELFFINLNQTDAYQITSGPGEKRFPSWEPRGQDFDF